MSEPLTRDQLLQTIKDAHAELEAALSQLSEAQMSQPGVGGQWAIKDHLAHITWWEQSMLHQIEAARRGEPQPRLITEGEDPEATIDRINEGVFTASHPRPLEEIRADYDRSYGQILELVQSFSDDELADPTEIEQALGRSLQPYIEGDTYGHYAEHVAIIRDWINQSGGRSQTADRSGSS